VFAYIKRLKDSSPVWNAETTNCTGFIGDIAAFMGLKTPSRWTRPENYVNELQALPGCGAARERCAADPGSREGCVAWGPGSASRHSCRAASGTRVPGPWGVILFPKILLEPCSSSSYIYMNNVQYMGAGHDDLRGP